MFSQGRRPSDSDSSSTQTSNVTSRATTPSDWGLHADRRLKQRPLWKNFQYSLASTISENGNSAPQTTSQTSKPKYPPMTEVQSENQSKTWINPYWTSNPRIDTSNPRTRTNETGTVPTSTRVQQLIPGSILINDRGEIYDRSLQPLTNTNNNNNNTNASNPQTNHSNEYLTPTHIQRRIVTSLGLNMHPEESRTYPKSESSSNAITAHPPQFTRQQTFPGTNDKDLKTWVNPYWPKPNQQQQPPPPTKTSKAEPWVNPYWGPKAPKPATTTWQNVYLQNKDATKGQSSSPSAPPNENSFPTILHHAWETAEDREFDFQCLPTPFFYKRIYPVTKNDKNHPDSSHMTPQNTTGFNVLMSMGQNSTVQNRSQNTPVTPLTSYTTESSCNRIISVEDFQSIQNALSLFVTNSPRIRVIESRPNPPPPSPPVSSLLRNINEQPKSKSPYAPTIPIVQAPRSNFPPTSTWSTRKSEGFNLDDFRTQVIRHPSVVRI